MSVKIAMENMKVLKGQMDACREEIDAAEEKEKYAREQIKEAEAKIELAKTTMESFKMRIAKLQQNLRAVNIQCDIKEKHLLGYAQKTEDENHSARQKQTKEEETEYRIAELEDVYRRLEQNLVEKEKGIEDLTFRYETKRESYDQVQRRLDGLERKLGEKMSHLDMDKQQLNESIAREKALDEQLGRMEDTISELEANITAKTERFDEADRKIKLLTEDIFNQRESINDFEMRNRRCREELGDISDTAGQIASIMQRM